MFNNSLDNKPIFTKPDGTEVRDLTVPTYDLTVTGSTTFSAYKVSKEFEMRIDLISGAVYNDSMYAEHILKFNGISNPFSIKEGDVILIPNLNSMQEMAQRTEGVDVDGSKTIRNSYRYIDPLKIPKSDTNFQNRQIVGGAPDGALPPNLAKEGESPITYRNGRVYFGADVDTCLQNGMTQSEYLTTVIKSKKV